MLKPHKNLNLNYFLKICKNFKNGQVNVEK